MSKRKRRNDAFPNGSRILAPKRGRKPKGARGPFAVWIRSTGKSLSDIADLLGWSPQNVTNLRAGHCSPSLERALHLEKVSGGAVPAMSWRRRGSARA